MKKGKTKPSFPSVRDFLGKAILIYNPNSNKKKIWDSAKPIPSGFKRLEIPKTPRPKLPPKLSDERKILLAELERVYRKIEHYRYVADKYGIEPNWNQEDFNNTVIQLVSNLKESGLSKEAAFLEAMARNYRWPEIVEWLDGQWKEVVEYNKALNEGNEYAKDNDVDGDTTIPVKPKTRKKGRKRIKSSIDEKAFMNARRSPEFTTFKELGRDFGITKGEAEKLARRLDARKKRSK